MPILCDLCTRYSRGSNLRMFVKDPFTGATNYANGPRLLREHSTTKYHQASAVDAASFQQSYRTGPVIEIATSHSQRMFAEKQEFLKSLVVHICGVQGLPMRGHRDGGPLTTPDQFLAATNEGNFRALLLTSVGEFKTRSLT